MQALSSASLLAWRACGSAMTVLATLVATQQGSAACLLALQMLAACTDKHTLTMQLHYCHDCKMLSMA